MKKKRKAVAKRRRRGITLQAGSDDSTTPSERWYSYYRPKKTSVTLRLDADVVAWFKGQGPKYQTRINMVLRKAMANEKNKAG